MDDRINTTEHNLDFNDIPGIQDVDDNQQQVVNFHNLDAILFLTVADQHFHGYTLDQTKPYLDIFILQTFIDNQNSLTNNKQHEVKDCTIDDFSDT